VPGPIHGAGLPPVVDVLISNDVVFTQIVPELHFDNLDLIYAEIFEAVFGAEGDIDGLAAGEGQDFVIDGHGGGAADHSPMLVTMLVALQGQATLWVYRQAFDFKAGFFFEDMEGAPGPCFADHAETIVRGS
jgi:hypothetical protein